MANNYSPHKSFYHALTPHIDISKRTVGARVSGEPDFSGFILKLLFSKKLKQNFAVLTKKYIY
jgi:hypothetical protein